MLTARLALVVAIAPMACMKVDIRTVDVQSNEVQMGALDVYLDYSDDRGMTFELLPFNDRDDSCPVLGDDARWSVHLDGGMAAELEMVSAGGGYTGVDCALKCRDLVALETVCSPAVAELRSPVADELIDADLGRDVELVLEDGSGAQIVRLPAGVLAGRRVRWESDAAIVVADGVGGRAPFRWSHPDDYAIWANNWPDPSKVSEGDVSDGDIRQFRVLEGDGLVLHVGSGAEPGEHRVYMGSRTDDLDCALGDCRVHHMRSESILVRRP